jgi:hypothetical protein
MIALNIRKKESPGSFFKESVEEEEVEKLRSREN